MLPRFRFPFFCPRSTAGLTAVLFVGGALGLAGGAGCKRDGAGNAGVTRSSQEALVAAKASDGFKRYPLTGEVVSLSPERKTLIVQHDEIPGYMPAMTMDFAVAEGDLAILKPGQRLRATLVELGDGAFRLEQIWPDDKAERATVETRTKELRQDTLVRGSKAYRDLGETLPSFALYDQSGQVVDAQRFRGKQVMLNFIFTRCPIATMCPAATAKMIALQKAASAAGVNNLEIVSITLDPAYDTPGVLRDYADARGIDTAHFSFLTGPESAIRDLLTQLGVDAFFEGGLLRHTLATLLIDESGNLVHREDGSAWEIAPFLQRMKRAEPS